MHYSRGSGAQKTAEALSREEEENAPEFSSKVQLQILTATTTESSLSSKNWKIALYPRFLSAGGVYISLHWSRGGSEEHFILITKKKESPSAAASGRALLSPFFSRLWSLSLPAKRKDEKR